MNQKNGSLHAVGNYLSRMRKNNERRRHNRRQCNFKGRVLFTKNGAKNIAQYIVVALDISEGGVKLHSMFAEDFPQHFYLFIGQYQHGIGCSVVTRTKEELRCEFIKEQTSEMIDYLANCRRADATLSKIKHPLFDAPVTS